MLRSLYQHVVAAQDVIVNHGLAAHLQRESIALAGEVGELQSVLPLDGFHRHAGGDPAREWNFGGSCRRTSLTPFLNVLRRYLERPALIEEASQIVARFERLDVLMHRGQGCEVQALGEFLVAG